MKYTFLYVVELDEDGLYVASVPALPGCHTQAKTLDELTERIREAIEAWFEGHAEKFEPKSRIIGTFQTEVALP